MNLKIGSCLFLVCAWIGAAFADVPDSDVMVLTDTPPVYDSAIQDEGHPLAGGVSGDDDNVPVSKASSARDYLLAEARIGKTFEVATPSLRLGQYLVDIPANVDWERTMAALSASEAYASGQIALFPNSSSPEKRILFSAGGTFELPWVVTTDDGVVTNRETYVVHTLSADRPHRLFWTSYPYNGPGVSMSGKYIQLFGLPDIVQPRYKVDATSGTSNVVFGVYLDTSSMTLHAVADGKDGPRGQFVVAYYDSGSYDEVIGVTVVEVLGPDVSTLEAHVGDRLQPYGGGYDITGLMAYIEKGAVAVDGDTASPYLEVFAAQNKYNEKNGAVYAIAPTDGSANATGSPTPARAHIYWEAPDEQDVLWPFEEDYYLISWNPDDPKMVVSDDSSSPGIPLYLPSTYATEVSAYMKPGGIASSVSNGVVEVTGAGHFLLRLLFDDDVRYFPIQSCLRTDAAVASDKILTMRIGETLTPPVEAEVGTNLASYVTHFGETSQGYVYAAKSAKVWNPNLYRDPEYDPGVDTTITTDEDDPYDSLASSIILVAETSTANPVEAWWYRVVASAGGEELPEPVLVPGLACRYAAKWPDADQAHEIALISQLGSAAATFAAAGKSLYLYTADNGAGSTNRMYGIEAAKGMALGVWVNPSPDDAGDAGITATTGRLLAYNLGSTRFTLDATALSEGNAELTVKTNGSYVASFVLPTNAWSQVLCTFSPFGTGRSDFSVYADGSRVVDSVSVSLTNGVGSVVSLWFDDYSLGAEPGCANGVRGWGADAFTLWNRTLTTAEIAATRTEAGLTNGVQDVRLFQYDFTSFVNRWGRTPVAGEESFCADAIVADAVLPVYGSRLYRIEPGCPSISYGSLPVSDGCTPRIYRQPDKSLPGYHLNLEHAFTTLATDASEAIVWALRNDLDTSPYVLVEYADNGAGAMSVFRVVASNVLYSVVGSSATVGTQMVPPKPISLLGEYWNVRTYFDNTSANSGTDQEVRFTDRKLNDWARRDGSTDAHYYYLVQDGFDFPGGKDFAGYLPWRCECAPATWETDLDQNLPAPWPWTTHWPDRDTVPVMQVGQTLTKAVNGLPEVWNMASCEVVYPTNRFQKIGSSPTAMLANVVDLVDPVTAQTAPLEIAASFTSEYGFELGSSGTTQLRKGKYYFTGLPPSVSDRFYVDANADVSNRMVLVGKRVEPTTGNAYLKFNVLSEDEAFAIRNICKEGASGKDAWDKAVDVLAAKTLLKPEPDDPVANYALIANGNDSGWVVIAENNSTNTDMVATGDPIDLKVIYVTNTLYCGAVSAQTDSLNKLSELLTIQYNESFALASTNFTFAWYRVEPHADGSVPGIGSGEWTKKKEGAGLTSFLIGENGTSLSELVNAYWCMHYKPVEGTPAYYTCGGEWSQWTENALAEGWVQRVLNSVTPFAQRVEDFYSNPSDIAYTMLEQIGGPYAGDVALNNDNLTEVGLLELYQTIFNKAEKMSLGLDGFDPATDSTAAGVFKQLTLAATRLSELYQLLGAEAYSDAKNPLISQGFDTTYASNLAQVPSTTFCFQNQVRTLLDEELALLRGRTAATSVPNMATAPCYNRLYWNFTKGITEGEVAYVNNYGIWGVNGVIDESCAKALYPQGHGDAWGHYLSALTCYYRMLRNSKFDWVAAMGEMNIGETAVNEDYTDEQKFADAAAKLAQIGLDVVDLTARKAWKDNGGDIASAYFDGLTNGTAKTGAVQVRQGFGYGEWASRAALGGAYNWMVVNALLPTNETPAQVYVDKGINQITRPTATQLTELCASVDAIQSKVNTLDAGLNPLGLSQNAVPMDIDPDALAEKNSHFDQILERAEKALENCTTVLDYANQYGARLQQIANKNTSESEDAAIEEEQFNRELIAIYGTPYSGDIGTGKTYVQDYDGPDLYHYMYLDLSEYGLTEKDLGDVTIETRTYQWNESGKNVPLLGGMYADTTETLVSEEISYQYSALGLAVTPDDFGKRVTEGSIQTAGRTYLNARLVAKNAKTKYDEKCDQYDRMNSYMTSAYRFALATALVEAGIVDAAVIAELMYRKAAKTTADVEQMAAFVEKISTLAAEEVPDVVVAGMAVSISPQSIAKAAIAPTLIGNLVTTKSSSTILNVVHMAVENVEQLQKILEINTAAISEQKSLRDTFWSNQLTYWNEMYAAYEEYSKAVAALSEADAAYRAEIAKGEQLLNQRASARMRRSNQATAYRYADMFNRVQRNNALTKYSTAFDTAQRYVWQLAKVYDYETGLLASDPQAGDAFLSEIIGSRQLGYPGVSTSSATDKGLYDIVNRMKENWAVLKGRLGVNNPENTTTEFSLRYELFRIQYGAAGDEAWQRALRQYWVADINADSTFTRYCQPLATAEGTSALKEPGLVIPFSTSIYAAENFFGKTLQGGDSAFSSADYATKIHAIGLAFTGYEALANDRSSAGLKKTPYVYLVPAGRDYMRAPAGTSRTVLGWNVVDQVLPLPYTIGSTELDDEDWISTVTGLDGTSDSAAKIRRHAPFRADGDIHSTRLVGRSVWNDNWVLVIPGVELNADREKGLDTFIRGVSDIKLKIKAYARQGN